MGAFLLVRIDAGQTDQPDAVSCAFNKGKGGLFADMALSVRRAQVHGRIDDAVFKFQIPDATRFKQLFNAVHEILLKDQCGIVPFSA